MMIIGIIITTIIIIIIISAYSRLPVKSVNI